LEKKYGKPKTLDDIERTAEELVKQDYIDLEKECKIE